MLKYATFKQNLDRITSSFLFVTLTTKLYLDPKGKQKPLWQYQEEIILYEKLRKPSNRKTYINC